MSKKKAGNFELRSRGVPQKTKFMLWGTVLGLLIGSVSVFIAMDMQRVPKGNISSRYHPSTYAVAEKFICGCPECQLELVKCQCDHLAGGKHELGFISERLKQGHSETEVVNEVFEQYGNIKETYRNLL